jgi:hypothetical protein
MSVTSHTPGRGNRSKSKATPPRLKRAEYTINTSHSGRGATGRQASFGVNRATRAPLLSRLMFWLSSAAFRKELRRLSVITLLEAETDNV